MIEIRHLKLIKEIVATGNMTRAADRLFLAQPSLSYQLKEIEGRLDTSLFIRVNKKLILTEAGKKILVAAEEILPRIESLEKQIEGFEETNPKELRVSAKCFACYEWLLGLIREYNQTRPDVLFDVVTETPDNLVDLILNDEIDIAITHHKTKDHAVHFEKIFDDEHVLVTSAEHPLANNKYVAGMDVTEENLIIFSETLESDYLASKLLIPSRLRPRRVTKMQIIESGIEMVKAGMGITSFSRRLAKSFVRDDSNLKLTRITKRGLFRTWHLAVLKEKSTYPYIQEFIAFVKEREGD